MQYDLNINSTIGGWGVTQQGVAEQLKRVLEAKGEATNGKKLRVDVRISSLGGALSHALDIRQQLKDCEAEVVAHIFSLTASAATVIATGASKTLISKYALYLVHRVSLSVDIWEQLNAGDLAEQIAKLEATKSELERMDLVLLALYAEKTGRTVEELRPILEEGRWLTAEEALNLGFVDGYVEDANEEDAEATNVAIATYSNFSEVPKGLESKLGKPRAVQAPLPQSEAKGFFREMIEILKNAFMMKTEENTAVEVPKHVVEATTSTNEALAELQARIDALETENAALREEIGKQPGAAEDSNPEATEEGDECYVSRAHEMVKAWV